MNKTTQRKFLMPLMAAATLVPALAVARAAAAPDAVFDFRGLEEQITPYLELYHDPAYAFEPNDLSGHFSYQPGRGEDLYGSADVVYLLFTLGQLESRTTPEGRREWAALIRSWQDPESGWFTRGNETPHFKEHATAYAVGALVMLGSRPLYPLSGARPLTASEDAVDQWLSGIWWDLVWVGSHEGGGVAAALTMTGEAPDEFYDWYFGWLGREVNPDTGVWQRAWFNRITKKPNMHDMGGAAHFWWVYQHRGRPIPYPERVIDTVLALQLPSGLWDKKLRKGDFPYCINLDAVNGLKLASLQLTAQGRDYRREDVSRAMLRYLQRCQEVLAEPGAVMRLYGGDSHDLPGALIGIAEADLYFQLTTGTSRITTSQPWTSALQTISWL